MKILVADDDPISALVLSNILAASGHECQVAQDGNEAWEILSGENPPSVVFIDWMMPGIDGLELTRRTRALGRTTYTYIVIVSALNRQEEVLLGYEAGADDFITKPYRPEEVIARQRVAERVVHTTSSRASLSSALREAAESKAGSVVVRSGPTIGRIVFQQGKVVWASLSTEPSSVAHMLASRSALDVEEIRAAVEESNAAGISLAQVILNWNLLREETLRSLMRAWISQQVTTISLLEPSAVLFAPFSRTLDAPILFDYEDFVALRLVDQSAPRLTTAGNTADSTVPANGAAQLSPDEADLEEVRECLDRAMEIEGVLSSALYDTQTARWLLTRGDERDLDLDLAWRNIKLAMSAPAGDEIDDIIISTSDHIFILRHYSRSPLRFVFLAADRARARLGMVRRSFAGSIPSDPSASPVRYPFPLALASA